MSGPIIYPGVKDLHYLEHVPRAVVSVNRLERRASPFVAQDWILDSGAFSRIMLGRGHMSAGEYVGYIRKFGGCGRLQAAVVQDYMCEPEVLAKTGKSVEDHQRMTLSSMFTLRGFDLPCPIMPVLQGWTVDDYRRAVCALAPHVSSWAWVGVGSVCKRQGSPLVLAQILEAIHELRPKWRLHGFGVKVTALAEGRVYDRLYSVDSSAWSFDTYFREGSEVQSLASCLAWLRRVEAIRPDASQLQLPLAL